MFEIVWKRCVSIHVCMYLYRHIHMIISSISKDPKTRLCDARSNMTISLLQLKSSRFCSWNWWNSGFRPLATSYGCLQRRVETRHESCVNRNIRFGLAETYLQHGSVTTAKDVEVHIQYCVYTFFVNSSSSSSSSSSASSYQPVPNLILP